MPKVELHGAEGTRTLDIKATSPRTGIEETIVLSPLTIQEVIRLMPRRWINVDEIVIQLKRVHGIQAGHRAVEDALKYCELERKGIGIQMEIRRHDDGASIQHRKACFVAIRELSKSLQKFEIDEDIFWEWVKKEYNVESRTQMDAYQWAGLSAELNAARRDYGMLKYLARRINREIKKGK